MKTPPQKKDDLLIQSSCSTDRLIYYGNVLCIPCVWAAVFPTTLDLLPPQSLSCNRNTKTCFKDVLVFHYHKAVKQWRVDTGLQSPLRVGKPVRVRKPVSLGKPVNVGKPASVGK